MLPTVPSMSTRSSMTGRFWPWLAPEDKGAKAGGSHNIGRAVMFKIDGQDSVPNAAAVIDEMRNQPGASRRLGIANGLIPIEDRRTQCIGIDAAIQMGEISLACN